MRNQSRFKGNPVSAIKPEEQAFHAKTADDTLANLNSSQTGLSAVEVSIRQKQYGRNELPTTTNRHPLTRFLSHFHNTLIYLLLISAITAWALGHLVDAAVIVGVVLINAIIGFIQEGKAENALNAISSTISPQASVRRDGQRVSVPVAELVPGDLVFLEAGDRVPADLRLLRARGLLIEEAILTGESVAAEKQEQPVASDVALGDRSPMAYSGTMVVAGQGLGVVTATGLHTEIGHISGLLGNVQSLTTPLLRQINQFGRRFTAVTLTAAVLVFLFAVYVRHFPWGDALIAVVALAVSAIPEGLPAVITITLAIGVQRMASRNVITRRLPAVETLGATSVICSDKTGTLTRNEMTARRLVIAWGETLVEGSGYTPEGYTLFPLHPAEMTLIRTGLLCNDAQLRCKAGHWSVDGDPMEGALVTLAMKAGLDPTQKIRAEWARQDEIPFDARYRFMATMNSAPDKQKVVLVKGAPERLLNMCSAQAGKEGEAPLDFDYWMKRIAVTAADGERVLGFAMKVVPADKVRLSFKDVEQDLTFLGLIGFIDPPRKEAATAIAECQSAGIAVKIITGDHAATAGAIARQLGLADTPKVLTGHELDQIPHGRFNAGVKETDVFARTSPEHKLRIVRALQANGAVVSMTGDGVNDAPSLKQADIGIAMGKKGTEAAKEASQMVLLDDNFASIVAAVHEGRTAYDNIRKVISWTLPTNGGEVLTVLAAILLNFTMPMTPAQILWINMITAISLGLVLAFEPAEPNVMQRPPRQPQTGLLSRLIIWRIVFVSLVFVAGALSIFFHALNRGLDVETARTMVVNTIVVLEIFYLFNIRYLSMTSFTWRGALGTPPVLIAIGLVVVAQFSFTYLPVMQQLFVTKPVAPTDGLLIFIVGITAMIILEGEKYLVRRFGLLQE